MYMYMVWLNALQCCCLYLTQMLEVALLMGLMCKFSCEECEFVTFQEASWHPAQVERGTILDTLQQLLEQQNEIRDKVCVEANSFL